jgi:hypothetical protein
MIAKRMTLPFPNIPNLLSILNYPDRRYNFALSEKTGKLFILPVHNRN